MGHVIKQTHKAILISYHLVDRMSARTLSKFIYAPVFIFLLSCCSKSSTDDSHISGAYGTTEMGSGSLLMASIQHNSDAVVRKILMVKLRPDSSFIYGTCNCQVLLCGKYTILSDSILFYNIYNFHQKATEKDRTYFFDRKEKKIYIKHEKLRKSKYPTGMTIIQKDHKGGHLGFLRNESMDLKELISKNEFWPLDVQMQWVDSVQNTAR
jgi:hypothetical protein